MAHRKITVSLPEELAAAAQAAASADDVSVSGWLARAAEQQIRLHERRRLLQEWQAEHGPFSPQEIAGIDAEIAAAESALWTRAG